MNIANIASQCGKHSFAFFMMYHIAKRIFIGLLAHTFCDATATSTIGPREMGYLRCEACGAKALSAASTCPKCSTEFEVFDGRGSRVSLKRCGGCGIMHRQDRRCRWCDAKQTDSTGRSSFVRTASGIAAVALVAVGSWAVREPAADALAKVIALTQKADRRMTLSEVPPQLVASAVGIPAVSLPGGDLPALAPFVDSSSLVLADSATSAPTAAIDPATAPIAGDTTQWVAATAITGVNVRANAGRSGNVVGIIKPSEKAMLGSVGRGGYRQVKSPEMSGWADPKLFVADSTRARGL